MSWLESSVIVPASFLAVYICTYGCHWLSMWMLHRSSEGYDNEHTREQYANIKGKLPREYYDELMRVRYAHANGCEATPQFYAPVVIALFMGCNIVAINVACLVFVLVRILFNVVYIKYNHVAHGWPRTFIYLTGVAACLYCYAIAIIKGAGGASFVPSLLAAALKVEGSGA